MQVEIKREKPENREEVHQLLKLVYEQEGFLPVIDKLRKSDIFIPELSRVAKINNSIIGVIMYSKGEIVRGRKHVPTIIMSNLAVLPAYQGFGIGAELISNSFMKARKMKYESVLVYGPEDYFSIFGFVPASKLGITTSLEVADDDFMAFELEDDALTDAHGHVKNHPLYNELAQFHF